MKLRNHLAKIIRSGRSQSSRYQIENHGIPALNYGFPEFQKVDPNEIQEQPSYSLSSGYGFPEFQEVEPALNYGFPEFQEVEPLVHSLTSPPHSPITRPRRTGPRIWGWDHIKAFFSSGKTKNAPTYQEYKKLKKMVGLGPQGERISVNERHIVEPNGRNHWNEDVSFRDRLFSCPNCPDSDLVYNNRQMLLHSKAAHADMRRICEKCGLVYNGTKHVCPMLRTKDPIFSISNRESRYTGLAAISNRTKHDIPLVQVIISKTLAYRSQMRQRSEFQRFSQKVDPRTQIWPRVEPALNYGFPEFQEVEPPLHSLTSPPHSPFTRPRRTRPRIWGWDRIKAFFSSGKTKKAPTYQEYKKLKKMVGLGPQGERISFNERHIVEQNGRVIIGTKTSVLRTDSSATPTVQTQIWFTIIDKCYFTLRPLTQI
ncbi:hypothetical protein FCV25MIE_19964 [Fagus crenata]